VIERPHNIPKMPITASLEGHKLPMSFMQTPQADQCSHSSYCSSNCFNTLNRDPPVKTIHTES
jgi:hypothetical protein